MVYELAVTWYSLYMLQVKSTMSLLYVVTELSIYQSH
jgi:hypothetical protein